MTVQTALQQACRLLEEAGIAAPRLAAEVLLSHSLGRDRVWLYAHPEAELNDQDWVRFARTVYQRLGGKPTQYITGVQEFYGREFVVTPDVLIPRPETEHVVEAVLALPQAPRRIVDIGCGSGAIAVTLQLELGAEVWGTDISMAALRVAAENARRLGARIHLAACDLASALAGGAFDLVVSNHPYVSEQERPGLQREVRDWEPACALFAGPTGVEFYQRLVGEAGRLLVPGGSLIMELGYRSLEPVRAMLGRQWEEIKVIPDLAGIPRVLSARLICQ